MSGSTWWGGELQIFSGNSLPSNPQAWSRVPHAAPRGERDPVGPLSGFRCSQRIKQEGSEDRATCTPFVLVMLSGLRHGLGWKWRHSFVGKVESHSLPHSPITQRFPLTSYGQSASLNVSLSLSGPIHTEPKRAKIDPVSFYAVQEYLRRDGVIAKPHRAVETR